MTLQERLRCYFVHKQFQDSLSSNQLKSTESVLQDYVFEESVLYKKKCYKSEEAAYLKEPEIVSENYNKVICLVENEDYEMREVLKHKLLKVPSLQRKSL